MISVMEDPVFLVRGMDGGKERVGLRNLILNAHTYADLLGRTPTGRCAVMRLCIAFLEDMLRPEDLKARRELFEQGSFDPDELERYIKECEADGPRFLLDDEKHPFMQAAYDPILDAKAEKPISALTMDLASGNNHVHWDHRGEEEHELTVPDALEALLETYLFCPGGTAGPSNCNNTPPVYFLLVGRNLFETLVLNMVSAGKGEELRNIPFGEGEVPWRKSTVIRPKESVSEMSYLRAYTWQPRRATLRIDEDGMVRTCLIQPGLDFRGDGRWKDPQVAFFLKKDETWGTLKPEPGREIWRNVGDLLADSGEKRHPPVTIANCSSVQEDEDECLVKVDAVGLQTNQAAYLGWTQETLLFPNAFLQDVDKAGEFRVCVEMVENLVGLLSRTVSWELGSGAERKKKSDNPISSQACALFLQIMHDELFDRTMYGILNEEEDWSKTFAAAVRGAMQDVLDQVVNRSGNTVEMMKKQGRVAGILFHRANELLEGW